MTWALIRDVDNAWLAGPTDSEPAAASGQHTVRVALGYPDTATWSAARGAFVDLLNEAQCLASIDAIAEQLVGAVITITPGRSDLYRRKQAEVDKANALATTPAAVLAALNALTAAGRVAAYPLLSIEMTVMGYANLGQAYTFVASAIGAANSRLNAIEASRRAAKQAVRAAATLAAKNAAVAAATWPN